MSDFPVTIFHNPNCGTSRAALALIRQAGYEPEVVEYLKAGWTRSQLDALLMKMGARPRDVLRLRGTSAEALGLTAADATDDAILEAMVADPVLVERPIVETSIGAALARPAEAALMLLGKRLDNEA